MDVSAIVLAGGRSSRFGRDKLAAPLEGETVLMRTVRAVTSVASDVVVVTGADGPAGGPVALPDDVRLVHDPAPDGGPLVGVVAGLYVARYDVVIVVGGDMPWLEPAVLQVLVDALGSDGAATAAALESGGRVQQLPIVVRRDPALASTRVLIAAGTRRLGALAEALDVTVIPGQKWRALDPEAASLRDVDEPGDLRPG